MVEESPIAANDGTTDLENPEARQPASWARAAGVLGGVVFVISALLLNHTGDDAAVMRLPWLVGLGIGLFGVLHVRIALLSHRSDGLVEVGSLVEAWRDYRDSRPGAAIR